MRILIAGATGLIGSALLSVLSRTHRVYALARTPRPDDAGVQWHVADLAAAPAAWQLPESWDAAIYLAQSSGYREFPQRAADMVAVNVHAPIALLEASRQRGARAFVLASTANVYGLSREAITESGAIHPTTFYARTRRCAESLAEPFGQYLALTIARIFTVYGPGQRPDTLVSSIVDRVVDGQPVQVQGERGLLLSPVYLADAVRALAGLVEHPAGPGCTTVNVAGDEAVGIGELAALVGRIVSRDAVIERIDGAEPGGWIGDTRLLRSMTGWSPQTTLEQGLQQLVAARLV